tara:strand:- start:232 stop:870 length:639 start_codon:yes stop_codon:yes gene_type:complete
MAFLSDALRQQAIAEMRGQMLQDQIAKQVSRQIIGQIANQEIGRSIQQEAKRGRALQAAAAQKSRREVGQTALEAERDIAERKKRLNVLGAGASASSIPLAFWSTQRFNPSRGLPDAKIPTSEEMRKTRGMSESVSRGRELKPTSVDEDLLMYGQGVGSGGVPVVEDQDIVSAVGDLNLAGEPGLQTTLGNEGSFADDMSDEEFQKLISLIR